MRRPSPLDRCCIVLRYMSEADVSDLGKNRPGKTLTTRTARGERTMVYMSTVEVSQIALRLRRDDLFLDELLLSETDAIKAASLAQALCRIRTLMLEICRVPKRPSAEGYKIPKLVIDEAQEPPILPQEPSINP